MARRDQDPGADIIGRRDGAEAWLDQARWLHQQEATRLDSARSRASTMLGFTGGILAILARQPVPQTHTVGTNLVAAFTVAGTVVLAISAMLFAFVLWSVLVTRPSHEAVLVAWREWREQAAQPQGSPKRKVFVSRDFASLLLQAEGDDAYSPIATASTAATSRMNVLAFASGTFAVGLVLVSAAIVTQTLGGLT